MLEEFLLQLGISQNAIARTAQGAAAAHNEIVLGKRSVTADTAIRLAGAFGTSDRFWLGLQADYDLEEARRARQRRPQRVAAQQVPQGRIRMSHEAQQGSSSH